MTSMTQPNTDTPPDKGDDGRCAAARHDAALLLCDAGRRQRVPPRSTASRTERAVERHRTLARRFVYAVESLWSVVVLWMLACSFVIDGVCSSVVFVERHICFDCSMIPFRFDVAGFSFVWILRLVGSFFVFAASLFLNCQIDCVCVRVCVRAFGAELVGGVHRRAVQSEATSKRRRPGTCEFR
jgi:hypothetical protein